ncbi:MAG: lipoyl(octanoyl) transferase LipB [Aphanizomenon sp.]|jgi:lipoyl(octanoyl) transferase|uniref:Octanoyltransferase n=1 Tax=Aphanizomenon flos-aquae WA102 TaxID=1710896 RepID=A0A1B7X303_APHFL|nr:lipoyl(octanoyl) transferase LipB [Aphanizomenon flos-aquae Clear-A1]OBQ43732.1 MAG: octanoyltransferase [Aphanizomenon flos-aquae WA102]
MTYSTHFPKSSCLLYNFGLMPYETAHQWQRLLVAERVHNPELNDVLMLLEHPPVYTLGTGANPKFIKFNIDKSDYDVHRVERGGEVTYHCPGQLIGYPILNLRRYRQDLHWYLHQLEEVLIRVLAHYNLKGERIPGFTGVWLEGYKVAAIGIKVSKWITMHGFALNVCPDMTGFEKIIPCGIIDKPVSSLAAWIPDITCNQITDSVSQCFAEVFDVTLVKSNDMKFIHPTCNSHKNLYNEE